MTTLAWLGDPALKASAVERMRAHREADTFIQGSYAQVDSEAAREYRGCFHGCLTTEALAAERSMPVRDFVGARADKVSWHAEGERLFGIPRPLGVLLDAIFEHVPVDHAGVFALAATMAIPVGADLSEVVAGLLLDLLADEERGALRHTEPGSAQYTAVQAVIELYRRKLTGEQIAEDDWRTARRAAYAAADAAYVADADDAYAAADAAAVAVEAASAETASADAAADAVVAAADAAEDAADALAAETAVHQYYRWLGDRLIHHLSTARITATAA